VKKYNKENGRKNMRLQGYDYSSAGLYFLTIVVQNRLNLYGHIKNGKMILNEAGQMIEKWYREIENKYPDKNCHEMAVMPNHFHCIIENMEMDENDSKMDTHGLDAHVGAPPHGRPNHPDNPDNPENDVNNKYGLHNKKIGATIGGVMDWFKTMTTNEYIRGVKNNNWNRFEGKLWQRNYYDHIIRNGSDYERISSYIIENAERWENDKFNGVELK
jgi:REP element-mobilizing transposase RayT